MSDKLRELLDECREGPWRPEGEREDDYGVWLTNDQQDSLWIDAGDVALLLNAELERPA